MRGRKPGLKTIQFPSAAAAIGRPQPPINAPTCPHHLGDEGRAEWQRIVPLLTAEKLLAEQDRAALSLYCEAWEELVIAKENCPAAESVVLTDKGNPIQNPWLSIKNAAAERVRKLIAEFGLSPASRARLVVESTPKESKLSKYVS